MVTQRRAARLLSLRLGALEFVAVCVGCRPPAPALPVAADLTPRPDSSSSPTPALPTAADLTPRGDSSSVGLRDGGGDGGVSLEAGRSAVTERGCEVFDDINPPPSLKDEEPAWEGKGDSAFEHSHAKDPQSTSNSPAILKVSTLNLANGLSTFVFADGHTATKGIQRPSNCCHPLSSARIQAHAKALAPCCDIRLRDQRYTVDQATVSVTIDGRTCDHCLTERAWKTNVTARRCREAAYALQRDVCASVEQNP
jgi:hypothetical protein